MQIPLAFIDAVVIEEVSLPLWREAFDALGWPASLVSKRELMTHTDIVSALQSDTPSDELLQAIETLHDLGTPAGREALNAMLADRQIPAGTLPQDIGEREFALRLFLLQRSNSALAEVIARAQIQIEEGNHRRFNDFIGKKPKQIRDAAGKLHGLERAIFEYCEKSDLGNHVQVTLLDDDDGACSFRIMRSHHTRTPLAIVSGSAARAKIQYRPIHQDLVRYEPAMGRLRITARAASIVDFYQHVFGRVFFGDETFFFGDPVCSLHVLQEKGRAALSHSVYGAGRVWMTECIWERGDRRRLSIHHHTDCFDEIEALKLPLHEGQLILAKLKIEVIAKSTRPVTVTIRVPSRIEISQVRYEHLVNDVLANMGIRDARAGALEHDLWTLYPWRQPLTAWKDCFGAGTDSLVRQGVLVKTQLASVEAVGYVGAGRVLQAQPVTATEHLGVSDMPEIPSRSLSATHLDGLELNVMALQKHLRGILGITENAAQWADDGWLLDLGVLDIHGHNFRVAYALRQPPRGAAAAVKALAPSLTSILLRPKGVTEPTGVTEILLDTAMPDRHRVIQDIIASCNLANQLSALATAPKGARLVVDTQLGKIWFDRIEITTLKAGTQAFRFVEILARCTRGSINTHDLADRLSAGRNDGDQSARSAKTIANKSIRAALGVAAVRFEDPFPSGNGGYRLAVLSHVR